MNKKIDIISSIFKSEEYIKTFLLNVCSQSVFEQSILHVVSPKLSEKEKYILDYFKEKYSNINVIDLGRESSIYESWNVAIKNSKCPYITNMNCDDSKCQVSLERHLLELEAEKEIDLVFSDSFVSTEKNVQFGDKRIQYAYRFPSEISIENLLKYNPPHQSPMWRRALHDKFGLFREDMFSAADCEFWLRCYHGGANFKKINEILNIYYFNPNGVSTGSEKAELRIKEELDNKIKYANIFGYTGNLHGKLEDIIYKI